MNTKEQLAAECGTSLYWHGCYAGNYDLIAPESIAHPAKMGIGLCYRILTHLEELGLLVKGQDIVLDPMAGTGITNICAGALGLPSVSVELEEKFVKFQEQNKGYAERRLYKELDWTILKGDSRYLSQVLQDSGLKCVTSPPYEQSIDRANIPDAFLHSAEQKHKRTYTKASFKDEDYGATEGQIGNLPDKPLKSITSPPYTEARPQSSWEPQEAWQPEFKGRSKAFHSETEGQIASLTDKPLKSIMSPPFADSQHDCKHGIKGELSRNLKGRKVWEERFDGNPTDPDNIANLPDRPLKAITSPPYLNIAVAHIEKPAGKAWREQQRSVSDNPTGYSDNPENIGNLQDKPLKSITSPPYEGQICDLSDPSASKRRERLIRQGYDPKKTLGNLRPGELAHWSSQYSDDKENIGNIKSESYLQAMSRVYSEIAKCSDVLVVVVKDPTRANKIRELGKDTYRLLVSCGWTIVDYHRALLFEAHEQPSLFGGVEKKVKGRVSFFKRLSLQKGQPTAWFEHVLFAVRTDAIPNYSRDALHTYGSCDINLLGYEDD